jgi:hypothetical protein
MSLEQKSHNPHLRLIKFFSFEIASFQESFTLNDGLYAMEQRALKNVYICLNTNIYSYLETSGGQGSNLYLNFVRYFNTSVH